MCLVDKMADFTSLLFESINLIPHPLGYALTFKTRFGLATRGEDEDEYGLKGWDQCGPACQLGEFRHGDEIKFTVTYGGRRSPMKMRSDTLPNSCRVLTSSKTSFSVEILDFQLV